MKITVSVSPTTIAYMTSQFRWGFELEAYVMGVHTLPDIKEILDDHFGMTGLGVDTDASLRHIDEDTAFEYQSAILDITPTSLKRVATGLSTLKDIGVYVTNQCGFHTHFSHPNLSENDRKWILMGVAVDRGAIKKLTEFEGIPFWDAKYADRDFLEGLERAVQNGGNVYKILSDEKRRVLRLHPQGTLEWRGPRNFLDKKDPRICMKYVTRVREVASVFNEKLEAKEVGGKTREEWRLMGAKGQDLFKKHKHKFSDSMEDDMILDVLERFPWLQDADFEAATVTILEDGLLWKTGTWKGGEWKGGVWEYGEWKGGVWETGVWESGEWHGGTWKSGTWDEGDWYDGTWESGTWNDGEWNNGTWMSGTWNTGLWKGGTWKDGTWKDGIWNEGAWKDGTWEDGTWNGGTWTDGVWWDGKWYGGVWYGGMWQNGTWNGGTWDGGVWDGGTWKTGYDVNKTVHKNSPDTW